MRSAEQHLSPECSLESLLAQHECSTFMDEGHTFPQTAAQIVSTGLKVPQPRTSWQSLVVTFFSGVQAYVVLHITLPAYLASLTDMCATVICHALLCSAMPCCALPCPAVPCHTLLCSAIPCCALPCPAVHCHALLCSAIPCCAQPYPSVLCSAMHCRFSRPASAQLLSARYAVWLGA